MTGLISDNGRAHPLVCQLFDAMRENRVKLKDFARRVGVNRSTFDQWRTCSSPTLAVFVAAANALGYEVVLKPRKECGGDNCPRGNR